MHTMLKYWIKLGSLQRYMILDYFKLLIQDYVCAEVIDECKYFVDSMDKPLTLPHNPQNYYCCNKHMQSKHIELFFYKNRPYVYA